MQKIITKINSVITNIDNTVTIACLYHYGSVVYETASECSDIDYICIVNSENSKFNGEQVSFYINNIKQDVQFVTASHFQALLSSHSIWAVECFFLPKSHKLIETTQFTFSLDKSLLRRSFSATSSNSWAKCFKKIEVENEPYIGLKSLFHSLRILMFGIELAENNTITLNNQNINKLYKEIMSLMYTDNCNKLFIKQKYQPLFNSLSSHFRKVAPLE